MTPLLWSALGALLAALGIALGAGLLRRGRRLAGSSSLVAALAVALASALLASLALGSVGYRALSREELAATVHVQPLGADQFEVRFEFPDGREAEYLLRGDQLAVEARILKWHPWANLLGLHTAYELDRVAGRYARLEDERRQPRSVHALGPVRTLDLFAWAEGLAWLSPILDARYGSGSFIGATRRASYEIRVSTTGLLIRDVPEGRR